MRLRFPCVLAALTVSLSAQAAPELVFIAPSNHEMPLGHVENGELKGGIIKDVGDALAQRQARYLSIPSKRVGMALAAGQADAVCYVRPFWIEGDFLWTKAFLPNEGTIVGRSDVSPIKRGRRYVEPSVIG